MDFASKATAAQRASDPLWPVDWIEAEGERTIFAASQNHDCLVKLYCSWFCPFAQRAWIALEEKQVQYQYIEINPYEVDASLPGGYTKKALSLEQKASLYPEFVACSPRGLVPALNDHGLQLWESLPIIEYIDEKFASPTAPSLMPQDPYDRAMVRIWTAHTGDRIQKAFYTILISQDAAQQESAKKTFFTECRALARAMKKTGPYFLGEQFSALDIALAPFWERYEWVGGHYRDLVLTSDDGSDDDLSRLKVWWEATKQRPSVAKTIVCKPRLIASYSQYSRNEATSDFAKGMGLIKSSNTTNTK